jgi:hypothetical protein
MRTSKVAAYKTKLLLMRCAAPTPVIEKPEEEIDPRPEMVCFRGQTLALVRHYFELSSQVGRLPSLMGREFFRARVSHHAVPSFEDQAVFARDIELSIAKLSAEHQELILVAGMYNFTSDEIADMLHISKFAARTWFVEALDALSEIFLQAGILSEQRPDRRQRQRMGMAPMSGDHKPGMLRRRGSPVDYGAGKRPRSVGVSAAEGEAVGEVS